MAPGGLVYHVLNRGNARRTIFQSGADYLAFVRILDEVRERVPMRIVAWCLMPNHWHLVLWPTEDGELSDYLRLVTLTHAQRWHAHRGTAGTGHLYQGRFKSFAIQDDRHFLSVCRYVEANALRAGLVQRAQDWPWCSASPAHALECIARWPVARPQGWLGVVNEYQPPSEIEAIRTCAQRGTPFGSTEWTTGVASRLRLQSTLRARGRPLRRSGDGIAEKGS
jgi:putative transposase